MMDNKRKDRIVLVCCIFAVFAAIGIGFLGAKLFSANTFDEESDIAYEGIAIDGNIVDNNINNAVYSPYFARVGDKLYISLYLQGIYEISESGSKRLSRENGEVAVIDGELYFALASDLKRFDIAEGKIVEQTEHNSIYSIRSGDIYIDYTMEDSFLGGVKHKVNIIYKGETLHTIESDYAPYYYINGNDIYYTTDDSELKRYNVIDRNVWSVASFGDDFLESIIIDDGKLIFSVTNAEEGLSKVCYMKLDDTEFAVNCIVESEEYHSFNVYDGNVYVASTDGTLTKYDLSSGEKQVLVTKTNIMHCYIVDDKWVYFIDMEMNKDVLWRVTQDGSVVEKVLG